MTVNHGRGISVDITTYDDALKAFRIAKEVSNRIIIENYITGQDYRLLVINNVLVAAALRSPAHIIGDGERTVETLIADENRDPRRGFGHEKEN